jgi:hypothetical protein
MPRIRFRATQPAVCPKTLVPDQVETIERETLREVGLSFGGQVAVGERLSVGAGVALSRDLDQGSDQQVAVRVSYRF